MDGSHPRLKIPATAPSNPFSAGSKSTQQAPIGSVSFPTPSDTRSFSTAAQLPGLNLSSSGQDVTSSYGSVNGSSHTRQVPPKTVTPNLGVPFSSKTFDSKITKSDSANTPPNHLRDFHSLRQQAEKVLKEQQEQKRAAGRNKPPPEEAKPDFDVADILAQVLAAEMDTMLLTAADERQSPSDSFDENSFYSSKAPDSSSRNAGSPQSPAARQGHASHHDELRPDGNVDRHADSAQVDRSNSPYQVNPRPPFPTEPIRRVVSGGMTGPAFVDEDDEPEYSPPETLHHSFSSERPLVSVSAPQPNRFPRSQRGRDGYRPDDQMMVVSNQIASPSAPQPLRVSPLAVAKDPLMTQNRRQYDQQSRRGPAGSGRTSPENGNANQPRKKRKIQAAKKARPRRAESPDVVIKEEPVSPPPFHDVPPLGSRQRPVERPIYIDAEPAEIRHAPERQINRTPHRLLSDMDETGPYSAPRALSRSTFRDSLRQEPDLRRVVSLQNLDREFEAPRGLRSSRAPSFSYAETARPVSRAPSVYDRPRLVEERRIASPAPRPATQNYNRPRILDDRRVEPPSPRAQDLDPRYIAQPMAPPPRRILVDEYGQRVYNDYDRQASAAPIPARQDAVEYNERARIRNGVPPRAVSVFEDEPRNSRYVEDMPPPQMVYRRITENPRPATEVRYMSEAPRSALPEVRYITREPERASYRGGSVQVYDYQERPGAFVDDRHGQEETLVRVPAERSAAGDYSGPRDFVERVQSVRPEGRGLSRYREKSEMRSQAERPVYELRQESELQRPVYEVRRTAEGDACRRERYYRIDENGRMMEEPPTEMQDVRGYGDWH